ncbi:hypothetical protein NEHOM01_0761, partial [Nematocida homosporus]|uniref:uncharacterized protein n=1 Tax=Nematocida homosporus TaxID=1912981 RepID=UPI00221FB25D
FTSTPPNPIRNSTSFTSTPYTSTSFTSTPPNPIRNSTSFTSTPPNPIPNSTPPNPIRNSTSPNLMQERLKYFSAPLQQQAAELAKSDTHPNCQAVTTQAIATVNELVQLLAKAEKRALKAQKSASKHQQAFIDLQTQFIEYTKSAQDKLLAAQKDREVLQDQLLSRLEKQRSKSEQTINSQAQQIQELHLDLATALQDKLAALQEIADLKQNNTQSSSNSLLSSAATPIPTPSTNSSIPLPPRPLPSISLPNDLLDNSFLHDLDYSSRHNSSSSSSFNTMAPPSIIGTSSLRKGVLPFTQSVLPSYLTTPLINTSSQVTPITTPTPTSPPPTTTQSTTKSPNSSTPNSSTPNSSTSNSSTPTSPPPTTNPTSDQPNTILTSDQPNTNTTSPQPSTTPPKFAGISKTTPQPSIPANSRFSFYIISGSFKLAVTDPNLNALRHKWTNICEIPSSSLGLLTLVSNAKVLVAIMKKHEAKLAKLVQAYLSINIAITITPVLDFLHIPSLTPSKVLSALRKKANLIIASDLPFLKRTPLFILATNINKCQTPNDLQLLYSLHQVKPKFTPSKPATT